MINKRIKKQKSRVSMVRRLQALRKLKNQRKLNLIVKPTQEEIKEIETIFVSVTIPIQRFLVNVPRGTKVTKILFSKAIEESKKRFEESNIAGTIKQIQRRVIKKVEIKESKEGGIKVGVKEGLKIDVEKIHREKNLEAFIEAKKKEHLDLIVSNAKEYRHILDQVVAEHVNGKLGVFGELFDVKKAQKLLEKEGKIVEAKFIRRMQRIAQDQTRKMTAALAREEVKDSVFVGYFWRITGHHTRPSHAILADCFFGLDEKAPVLSDKKIKHLYPGEDYFCECTAEWTWRKPSLEEINKQRKDIEAKILALR